jgi:hypothetical protein
VLGHAGAGTAGKRRRPGSSAVLIFIVLEPSEFDVKDFLTQVDGGVGARCAGRVVTLV